MRTLAPAEAKKQGLVLAWGSFYAVTVNLLIIAAVLFRVVEAMDVARARVVPTPKAKRSSRPHHPARGDPQPPGPAREGVPPTTKMA